MLPDEVILLLYVDFFVTVAVVYVILEFVLNLDSIGLMQQWHCLLKKNKITSRFVVMR